MVTGTMQKRKNQLKAGGPRPDEAEPMDVRKGVL
jgi:hypothetical protein